MKYTLFMITLVGLMSCGPAPTNTPDTAGTNSAPRLSSASSKAAYQTAVARVEPVAEAVCRSRAPDLNCDFDIRVLDDPRLPPNAFQTLDPKGRPLIIVTNSLIKDARNADELAFILGHETAHHINRDIIERQQAQIAGALLGGLVAQRTGRPVQAGQRVGAFIGGRAFSKQKELDADTLGTLITRRAGYNPVKGALFFTRIPDPGDRFLGTHPPNAARIEAVKRANARLR